MGNFSSRKNTQFIFYVKTMTLANYFLSVSIFFDIYSLNLAADCQRRCEQSRGSIGKTGMKNLAMQGHSFRNYTLSKPYECHVKCFEEKCKCQAYQIRENRCELLDEDRFSAPEDFLKEKGYTYYDMNREYVNQVTSESNVKCLLLCQRKTQTVCVDYT